MDKLKTFTDKRGSLTLVESGYEIPFQITRAYWIQNVPDGEERGMHANKISYQYLVAVNGSVEITLEDIDGRKTYNLDSKDKGLLVPPKTWNELRKFSHDAVLLVLASHTYDETTYINSYEEFLQYIGK
ncbi:MAG: FdtA/QdtA family cupin domain-containing protein [Bacteroidaceae bacterium]|nr:FdtA/QdtA family cupin domain-containing protein [Bacteroidaceae bacterium]